MIGHLETHGLCGKWASTAQGQLLAQSCREDVDVTFWHVRLSVIRPEAVGA